MASPVHKVALARGRKIRDALLDRGWKPKQVPYADWAAEGPGINVVHYTSGKLVAQGKHAEDFFAEFFDELGLLDGPPPGSPDAVTEPIIGVDESGKGDYFGPLVIAAMYIRPEDAAVLRTLGVRDSKEIGDHDALRIAREIQDGWPTHAAVVVIGPGRYNEMHRDFHRNLNRLLAWGHATAAKDVLAKHPCERMLSDQFGDKRLVEDALRRAKIDIRVEQRPRAESHPAVAAASILARARFLTELKRLGEAAGTKLPKGAGPPVDLAAREIFRAGGLDALRKIAKVHFKTTDKVTGGGHDAGE